MDENGTKTEDVKESGDSGSHSPAIQELLARTGYNIEIFPASRAYGGPPPDFTGDEPKEDCQVFIGRLPPEMREDEIIPVFEKIGRIYVMRLIMERLPSTASRGYAFLCYLTPEDADKAITELNGHEIRPGVNIAVSKSEGNKRLYMGNIHKEKSQEELLSELQTLFSEGVKGVFVQQDLNDPKYNRGYAFVDFVDHKTAVDVRRQCGSNKKILFGRQIRNVDWADVQHGFNKDDVDTIKSLHISPISDAITEAMIKEKFATFGTVDKVQKIRDYAFVHMSTREEAVKAKEFEEKTLGGVEIEISFANPRHSAKKRKSRGGGRGRGHRGRRSGGHGGGNDNYPNFDYYGDPVYNGGEVDGYDYGYSDMYGGYGSGYYGGGYYDNNYSRGRGGGTGVWMTKRRKPNMEKKDSEKWLDPNVADQIGGNADGNWW